jgi:hypothetical protein
MNIYTFLSIGSRVNIDAGTFEVTPPAEKVLLTWNKADIVYVEYGSLSIPIHASKDTVVINSTSHAPGELTGQQLKDALVQQISTATNTGTNTPATATLTLTPVSPTQINAAWTVVTGATGYILERSTASNFSSVTTVYSGTGLSFNDTGLTAGTQYYYRVKAAITSSSTSKNATTQMVVVTNNAFPYTFPFNLS